MTVPHEFENGTPADANEMNENFAAVSADVLLQVPLDGSRPMTGVLELPDGPAASQTHVNTVFGLVAGVKMSDTGTVSGVSPTFGLFPGLFQGTVGFNRVFAEPPTVTLTQRLVADPVPSEANDYHSYQGQAIATGLAVVGVSTTGFTYAVQVAAGQPVIVDWLAVGALA